MFKDRLKEARKKLNLSANEIAKEIGLKLRTYYSYESGDVIPHIDITKLLSEKYGLNCHWLITGNGEMFAKEKNALTIKYEPLKIDKYEFGKRVNKIRIVADLVSAQMTEILGITERELAALISGEGKITLELMQKICENFDVTADWLLFGKE